MGGYIGGMTEIEYAAKARKARVDYFLRTGLAGALCAYGAVGMGKRNVLVMPEEWR